MTKEANSKIIERVRKILAMTKSPNENEAANAVELAAAILAEHQLSLKDVTDYEDDTLCTTVDNEWLFRMSPWARGIMRSVARLYFCEYFYVSKRIKVKGWKRPQQGDHHHFVGEYVNILITKTMASYLVTVVHELAGQSAKSVTGRRRKAYRSSFEMSCAHRLCQRLEEKRRSSMRQGTTTEEGKNLPALLDAYVAAGQRNADFMGAVGRSLIPDDGSLVARDGQGIKDGKEAANTIPIDPQIGETSLRQLPGMK